MKGEFIMKQERMTMKRMKELYPDEYLFLTDCIDNGTDITEGIVLAHSPNIDEINAVSSKFTGDVAIWYTGKLLPEGTYFL